MLKKLGAAAGGLVGAALLTLSMAGAAQAGQVLTDTYFGGVNTYNGQDVIGDPSVFDISQAFAQRTSSGALRITIDTVYAGRPGTAAADGTGYGALFLNAGAGLWTPSGSSPYASDTYHAGDWAYALTMPMTPGATSGASELFAVSSGQVVLSNVNGNPISAPNPGNPGFYFREGQAVQFTPDTSATAVATGSWSVLPGQIVFEINDAGALGDDLSLSWAMTCANDVIQGEISAAPEPAQWLLMMGAVAIVGLTLRRRGARPSRALRA